jgi:hypothetical protein
MAAPYRLAPRVAWLGPFLLCLRRIHGHGPPRRKAARSRPTMRSRGFVETRDAQLERSPSGSAERAAEHHVHRMRWRGTVDVPAVVLRSMRSTMVILVLFLSACSATPEDVSAWRVVGTLGTATNARHCERIDGVSSAMFEHISVSDSPETVRFETIGAKSARSVAQCIEEVGGLARVELVQQH